MPFRNIEPRVAQPLKASLTLQEAQDVLQDFSNGEHFITIYKSRKLPRNIVRRFLNKIKEIETIADNLMRISSGAPDTPTKLKNAVNDLVGLPKSIVVAALTARVKDATVLGTFDEYKRVLAAQVIEEI